MPFLLDLDSRTITQVLYQPGGQWESINISCERLVNHSHDIEWEYCPAWGIINRDRTQIIFPSHGMAYDVDYFYQGAHPNYTPSTSPANIGFKFRSASL